MLHRPEQTVSLIWSEAEDGDAVGYNTIVGYEVWKATTVDGVYSLLETIVTTDKGKSLAVISPSKIGDSFFYKIVTLGKETGNSERSAAVELKTNYTRPTAPTSVSITR